MSRTEDVLDVDATPCDEEGVGEDAELVNALGSHGRVHHEKNTKKSLSSMQ